MIDYDLTYLLSPDLSLEEAKKITEKIIAFLQKEKGVFYQSKIPEKIKLAYPIQKKEQAYLVSLQFSLLPEKMPSLKKKLKGEDKILRFLVFKKKPSKIRKKVTPKKPSPLPKKPSEKKVGLKEIEKKLEEILGSSEHESQ